MSASKGSEVKRHFRLSTAGAPLPTETVWVRVGNPPTMRVLLPWRGWERVVEDELFGIAPEQTPGELIPDTDVMLEAECRDGVEFPDGVESLRRRLARPDTPLRSTESWSATDVYQAGAEEQSEDPAERVFDEEEPTVQDVDVSVQQLDRETPSDTEVEPPLTAVTQALDREGWQYRTVDVDELLLEATAAETDWDVRITALNESLCRITSVYPHEVDDELLRTALAYSGTCRRGGFVYDESDSRLAFRTPFVPATESTVDALTENVTAVAEFL